MSKITITLTVEEDPAAPAAGSGKVEGTGEPTQDLERSSVKEYPYVLDERHILGGLNGPMMVRIRTDADPGDRWLFNGYSTRAALELDGPAGPRIWHFDSVDEIYRLACELSEMVRDDRQPLVKAVL